MIPHYEDKELLKKIQREFSPKDAEQIIFRLNMGDSVDSAIQSLYLDNEKEIGLLKRER